MVSLTFKLQCLVDILVYKWYNVCKYQETKILYTIVILAQRVIIISDENLNTDEEEPGNTVSESFTDPVS